MTEIILIAISLSMDAFAVSVSSASCSSKLRYGTCLTAAFMFGFFQFFMPLIGYGLSAFLQQFIEFIIHWIAFGLLAFIGGKMFMDALSELHGKKPEEKTDISDMKTLIILAIATSIDALMVGVSFSALNAPVFSSSVIIGIITFLICVCGFIFGKKLSDAFGIYAEFAGSAVLILIGIKVVLEHYQIL